MLIHLVLPTISELVLGLSFPILQLMTQKHRELTNSSELTQSLRGSFGVNLDSPAAEPVPLTSSSDKCWLLMLIYVLSYLNLIIALKSGY